MTVKNFINSSGDLDYPTILPSLDLNFANSKTLDPRITFTRSSSGSYVGYDGLIKYAGVNQPRFDHDPTTGESLGLLIEESRSNLFTYSEDFSNASWGNGRYTVSSNVEISPNGTLTASLIKATSVFNFHSIFKNPSLTANKIYTLSFFVKPAGITSVVLTFGGESAMPSQQNATFDLLTGTISNISSGSSASAIKYPNGWWRVSLTSVTTTSSNPTTALMYLGTTQFIGNQTSAVYVWGAQLEEGAFPTSYIPTTTSTRTRAADNAIITGTKFSSWYNQSEGTVYVKQILSSITTDTRNNIVYQISDSVGGLYFYNVARGDTNIFRFDIGLISYNRLQSNGNSTNTKSTYAYNIPKTNFGAYWNGIKTLPTYSSNLIPQTSFNKLEIGSTIVEKYNGTISRFTYYPKRLPNSQLQTLTR